MSKMLYLDTARLGQMSPTALKTHIDFVRLMAEDPSSLYTEQFLYDGAATSPEIPQRFQELANWPRIEGLKQQLRNAFAARTDVDTKVLLASRTTHLMRLGVRSLIPTGRRHLLLTDLTWPPYRKWIRQFAIRNGIKLSILRLSQNIWRRGFTADDVATAILDHVRRTQADSLFLPAVTHTGIRLPLTAILQSTSSARSQFHTIIDASQAYGHINTNEWTHLADFTFGGCHKWVRAYLPLGVGFARGLSYCEPHFPSGDPLTLFCMATAVESTGPMETVNLSPLFTVNGAISETRRQQSNAVRLRSIQMMIQEQPGWKPIETQESVSSMILFVQAQLKSVKQLPSKTLRAMFARAFICVTTYNGGLLRLSMPTKEMQPGDVDLLESALRGQH